MAGRGVQLFAVLSLAAVRQVSAASSSAVAASHSGDLYVGAHANGNDRLSSKRVCCGAG